MIDKIIPKNKKTEFPMKKFLVGAAAAIFSCYASMTLAAPESPFFVGALLGDSTLDIQSRAHVEGYPSSPKTTDFEIQDSQTFAFMVLGGYRFTDMIGIEAQYVTSLMDDKIYGAISVNTLPPVTSELHSSISAMGVYAVFRGGEDAYVKGRIGVANSEASFDADFASVSFSDTNLSFGVAIGQKLGSLGSVELSYMRYPDIQVDRKKFAEDFGSTAPLNSYTTVRRDGLRLDTLMLGYVFQF